MSPEQKYQPKLVNGRCWASRDEALEFLLGRAEQFQSVAECDVLVFVDESRFSDALRQRLTDANIRFESVCAGAVPLEESILRGKYCGVILGSLDVGVCYRVAEYLRTTELEPLPVEHYFRPMESYELILQEDIFDSVFFVSPLLIRGIDVFSIYEESLTRFEKKCQIRDYLDLASSLYDLHRREVPGEIAEFGSYRGHSGYLICRILEALGSEKKCYLHDTFEGFPEENAGVDYLWNDTHEVVYESVRSKFHDVKNVVFVKGDFTKTFEEEPLDELAMAFVDCDSYRGTKYLAERIFEDVLSPGGLMVFEDYGHPPLLGSRLAFHEFFDPRKDCFVFFSQFSGIQVVGKR